MDWPKGKVSCATVHPHVREATDIVRESIVDQKLNADEFISLFEHQVVACATEEMLDWFLGSDKSAIYMLSEGTLINGEPLTREAALITDLSHLRALLKLQGVIVLYSANSYREMFE